MSPTVVDSLFMIQFQIVLFFGVKGGNWPGYFEDSKYTLTRFRAPFIEYYLGTLVLLSIFEYSLAYFSGHFSQLRFWIQLAILIHLAGMGLLSIVALIRGKSGRNALLYLYSAVVANVVAIAIYSVEWVLVYVVTNLH